MGENCDDGRTTIRGRMDDRGRLTIKEDDRIALGCNDLDEDERALLEMDVEVRDRMTVEKDGGERDA